MEYASPPLIGDLYIRPAPLRIRYDHRRRRRDDGGGAGLRSDAALGATYLSSRFGAILREMSNCVLRASKSGVGAKDQDRARACRCGYHGMILTYDHRLVCIEECIPVHAAAIDLTTRPQIPDTPENVAKALVRAKPKKRGEWKYLKEGRV